MISVIHANLYEALPRTLHVAVVIAPSSLMLLIVIPLYTNLPYIWCANTVLASNKAIAFVGISNTLVEWIGYY